METVCLMLSSQGLLACTESCKTNVVSLVNSTHIYLPLKMEKTECSETSAYKLQTPVITQKKAYNIQNKAKA